MTEATIFQPIQFNIASIDWPAIQATLFAEGVARLPGIATPATCTALQALYAQDIVFRKRIVMARHNFGQGDYAYFAAPLPAPLQDLRSRLYAGLAPIANRMMAALGRDMAYPEALTDFTARCHAAGQSKPTPLMLHYRSGDYNRLHQDLYGETVFPLQAVLMLSCPGADFTGGEFLLVENRPRQQSIGRVFNPAQGEMLIFPVNDRPVPAARGWMRASLRHGVSLVQSGERYTLGIILHDAA